MKSRAPLFSIILVTILAIVALVLWRLQTAKLLQTGPLEESQELVDLLVEEFPESSIHQDILDPSIIVVAHNGDSEQCRQALYFLNNLQKKNPEYDLKVYTLDEENYLQELSDTECWVNTRLINQWFVYPTIFVKDQVFVGFGAKTRKGVRDVLKN